jgi:hypothetical protein
MEGQASMSCRHTVLKIWFIYSQKWNCAVLFPIPTFMYLWAIYIFPGSVCLFGCSRIGRPILGIYKLLTDNECGNFETGHYNSVLEITRPPSFISGIHLYWILTGPSIAVHILANRLYNGPKYWPSRSGFFVASTKGLKIARQPCRLLLNVYMN